MLLRFLAILALLSAAYLVGNNKTSLWDRDEPRYAQASRQMLESGDWVVPRLLDDLRLKKPVMIYWLQATAMKYLGVSAAAARLPSVIATILTLILITWAVAWTVNWRVALWTAFIYGTAGLTVAAAKMAITDATLTLFVLSAQLCLYRAYVGKGGWFTAAAMGLAVGLAGLTKGPVVIGVLGSTILALILLRVMERWWPSAPAMAQPRRQLHPLRMILKMLLVLGIAIAVIAPWWHAVETRHPGTLWQALWQEVFVRAGKPQEGHKGPPGYYALAVWVTFFPWSLLLLGALAEAWRLRADPTIRFALAAVIGPWIMFELVATKLPHYVLPCYAPLSYLVARVLIRSDDGDTQEFHQPWWPNAVAIWSVIVAIVGVAPWLAAYFLHPLPWQTYVAFGLLSAWAIFYGVKVHAEFDRRYPAAAAMWMGLGMLGNVFILYTGVFPVSQYMRLGQRVADLLPADIRPGEAKMIDFKEMSVAFYSNGAIREESNDKFLIDTPPEQWPKYLVLTEAIWKRTPEELKAKLELVGPPVVGWNYSGDDADGNRIVKVLVLRKRT
ncbi:MAG: glycosyltransferase family 39 protein [Phycisphaerae bacterium]|nr:glycosyltransferase family 39 protein [Phycisphaerae bacterium]MDW8261532.1 glycosyltransferase family 39 protein [Phycisphaerales bacterium]